jgi:hypothetical protein
MQAITSPPEAAVLGSPLAEYRLNPSIARSHLFSFVILVVMAVIIPLSVVYAIQSSAPQDFTVAWICVGTISAVLGLLALRSYLNWSRRAGVRYVLAQNGLARIKGSSVTLYPYDQITGIQQTAITFGKQPMIPTRSNTCTLHTADGKKLLLDHEVVNIAVLSETLQQEITRRLLPAAQRRYAQGEVVACPPLTITREGISYGKKHLVWGEIEAVDVQHNVIRVKKQNSPISQHINVPVGEVINAQLFLNVVNGVIKVGTG